MNPNPIPLSFQKFRKERIREFRDGFDCLVNQKATLKEICKSYNRWVCESGEKNMSLVEIEKICEDVFGHSRGKREYQHLRVFLDREDLEEFDKENSNPTEEQVENLEVTIVKLKLSLEDKNKQIAQLEETIKENEKNIIALKLSESRMTEQYTTAMTSLTNIAGEQVKLNKKRDKDILKIIDALKKQLTLE